MLWLMTTCTVGMSRPLGVKSTQLGIHVKRPKLTLIPPDAQAQPFGLTVA